MIEQEPPFYIDPSEAIKSKAVARHLRDLASPDHWDSEYLATETVILILAKDTKIPMIESTLKMIKAKNNIE